VDSNEARKAFGTESDWRSKTVGDKAIYLRVTEFANSDDARRFNEFADSNYLLCPGFIRLTNEQRK